MGYFYGDTTRMSRYERADPNYLRLKIHDDASP